MGVNAGAFLGIMLCGWIGEKIGWSYGFGLAGIFMFLGMIQFYFAQPLFGNIGDKPVKLINDIKKKEKSNEKLNPFLPIDYFLIFVFVLSALVFIINDPLSKIGGIDSLNFTIGGMTNSLFFALIALISFVVLLIIRIPRYSPIVRDRMIVFSIFSFFTIFFWAAFEQGAGSLPIYTRDFTDRFLEGNSAMIFKTVDLLVTVIPLIIISYVLIKLFNKTYKKIIFSNMVLYTTFLIIWAIVIFKLVTEFQSLNTEIPVTWFAILNSLYIIIFAPLFTKWWDSKFNPPASVKYFLGLTLLGFGFGFLAYGATEVIIVESWIKWEADQVVKKSVIIWLILAYLFHTLGELCLSPMGLSYLSKLIPPRMIAFMFGIYYLAIAIGQKLAHYVGGDIDKITQQYSLSYFFMIFTVIPIILGLISLLLHPIIKRSMHGIK
jgi:POT family proton-dependent oligopeptide transporter